MSGALVSRYFAERLLSEEFRDELGEMSSPRAFAAFSGWWSERGSSLGPASSERCILETAALPLAAFLGFDAPQNGLLGPRVTLLSGLWTDNLGSLWRTAVRSALEFDADWCLCTNGRELRLIDARRTYSRLYVQFDLERASADRTTFNVLWALLRADSFKSSASADPLIVRIVHSSERHATAVGKSLRSGVIDAVGSLLDGMLTRGSRTGRPWPSAAIASAFDESLTIVHRVLFLMFAEARGLVPTWHPLYRDHYTIESLCELVDRPNHGRGIWEALQAIARLAHNGCRAGTLVVPAFNGRLFSPTRAPQAERIQIDDEHASRALFALSTRTLDRRGGRVRIDYRDLDVEQLGAVYESVLDYVPSRTQPVRLVRGGDERKASGSFYTPRSITDYLVRRTLHPLVDAASPDAILQLRIVDPSMGSGAFLVAACRYLAAAYERALIQSGACYGSDITDSDRAGFRRAIAQRCLYGVDLNPTAVQLARLSLWLATLAGDKPLTFLDHHLVVGNSLLGASLVDVARQPPGGRRRMKRATAHSDADAGLFSDEDLEPSLGQVVSERRWLEETPDDSLEIVREKEERLGRLGFADRWKWLLDVWCACWMWPDQAAAPDRALFAAMTESIMKRAGSISQSIAGRFLASATSIARQWRVFHWTVEFPEVYFSRSGCAVGNPGFDAVIGNPPWDMLRADSGSDRDDVRRENSSLKRFFRDAGVYRLQGAGHMNQYQLFAERSLMLLKKGGRLGLVLPSGIANDHTSAPLRRHLIERQTIDSMIGFENRRAVFPIHRSVRFVLLTSTAGAQSERIPCRFGVDDPEVLDSIPDAGNRTEDYPVTLTRAFLRVVSKDFVMPHLRTAMDLRITERIARRVPRLADAEGWGARFGRELNATDDRRSFHTGHRGIPVLEGKHIEPFRVNVEHSALRISEDVAERKLGSALFRRARIAYRDVASPTNRVSLIAAVLPPGVITTHTLFCLKNSMTSSAQLCLCGLLNSYVANYLVRQVMTTHLGSATIEDLRVPKPPATSALWDEITECSRRLAEKWSEGDEARIQACAARAYVLEPDEFSHIVSTFPLISESQRQACINAFEALASGSAIDISG